MSVRSVGPPLLTPEATSPGNDHREVAGAYAGHNEDGDRFTGADTSGLLGVVSGVGG